MADPEPATPMPTAACMVTTEDDAASDTPVPGVVPLLTPSMVTTPNGRRCLSKAMGYVPTPCDGSGLVGLGLEAARPNPY